MCSSDLGEVVWGSVGNYLEAGAECRSKTRPAIILAVSECQHMIAGLTTRAHTIDGEARQPITTVASLGLDGRNSFLWSPRPSFLCRLDVRSHAGWIDFETAELVSHYMNLPRTIFVDLLRAAARARRSPLNPR